MTDTPGTLEERLRAKWQAQPMTGGGSLTGRAYITDDGMRLRNPDGPEAADEIASLRARVEVMEGALGDRNAVHVNMLRGGIARPTIDQIIHIYGADAIRQALKDTP